MRDSGVSFGLGNYSQGAELAPKHGLSSAPGNALGTYAWLDYSTAMNQGLSLPCLVRSVYCGYPAPFSPLHSGSWWGAGGAAPHKPHLPMALVQKFCGLNSASPDSYGEAPTPSVTVLGDGDFRR